MSSNKRRKLSPAPEEPADVPTNTNSEPPAEYTNKNDAVVNGAQPSVAQPTDGPSTLEPPKPSTTTTNTDRRSRFAALRSRATESARANLAASKAEAQRSALDPTLLSNLSRRSAIAQHNLLKADTEEESGTGAFERKRAWDYTIEESERWDERMELKKQNREKNAFQDYSAEAGKIYERQVRKMEKLASGGRDGTAGKGRLREEYDASKTELLESAARNGNLEIVELETGEMVAIDKDGKFYSSHDNTSFVEQRPKKENVDRLVQDLRKAEEVRLKKRRARGLDDEQGPGDVTYINEKNKQFNMKLARFYDRYTGDIRESFERGTAI